MAKHSGPLDITSKPLAAEGFLSYRCKGAFGWIMIGATNDDEAMVQARRSSAEAKREDLQKWDGAAYVPCPIPGMQKGREDEIALIVTNCLTDHGWNITSGVALASKPFQTAVGKRNALVYLSGWGTNSMNCMLTGDYQSEGRNQLEPHPVLIPKNADADEVRRLATKFAAQVDDVVANTYAARLHRPKF